jgi:competence ComEA-like helix-hairpin-helix protein
MINRFRKFGFTGQDLAIITFLLIIFLAGLIIRFSGWKTPENFNYTVYDSKFEQQLKSNFSELGKSSLSRDRLDKLLLLKNLSDSISAEKDKQEKEELLAKFEEKININLAYTSDLQRLPGIGKVTADRIIEFRELNNGFGKIEDLMKVKGIGIKKFEMIKDLITTGNQ